MFSSCTKTDNTDEYIVNYPEYLTLDYCIDNYIKADPNLLYLRAADNDIGKTEIPGGYAKYCAIIDVPVDDYLLIDESILLALLPYKIVKNKYNLNLPQQEILSYKIKSVIIYSLPLDMYTINPEKRSMGEKMVQEIIASIDGNAATAFQNHIIDCIETNNYKKTGIAGDFLERVNFNVRVVFEDYENLVWDSELRKQNDTYYILFHTPADSLDGGWVQNWLPLNEEIAELIP